MKRKLKGKWTVDRNVDMDFFVSDEVLNEISDAIRIKLDQKLLFDLTTVGWHRAIILYPHTEDIVEWVKQNARGEYRWFEDQIAFEQSKDFEWFILRWS